MADSTPASRLQGIDVLRALAVIGMIYVHVAPASWLPGGQAEPRPYLLSLLDDLVRSRSMSVFVLLAGVSFALMSGGARPRTSAWWPLAVRALVLVVIGMALEEVVPQTSVIIAYYGLWFIMLLPLIRVRAATLFTAAGVLAVAGPFFALTAQNWGQGWFFIPDPMAAPVMGFDLPAQPLTALSDRLFGFGYPIAYTLPLLLAGMAIGRLDLHSFAVRRRMMITGGVLALGAWAGSAAAMAAWSGVLDRFNAELPSVMQAGGTPVFPWVSVLAMPPQMMFSFSVPQVVMMIGLCLLLIGLMATWSGARPLALMGTCALTWYAAHLLALQAVGEPPHSFVLFAGMVAVAMVLSVLWRRKVGRGPLEWLVHRVVVLAAHEPRRRRAAKTERPDRALV
jgi:uncharacterized protein